MPKKTNYHDCHSELQTHTFFLPYRDPAKATELTDLAKANSSLRVLQLDVTDHSAFPKVVEEVTAAVGAEEGLNLLINNAGVLPPERSTPGGVTAEMMRQAFEVNTVAPLFLTKAFLPLLTTAANKNAASPVGISRSTIVMMSTAVASIAENSGGGVTAYRASKTALNMVMKNLSIELKDTGILIMAMHPGWVGAEMRIGRTITLNSFLLFFFFRSKQRWEAPTLSSALRSAPPTC